MDFKWKYCGILYFIQCKYGKDTYLSNALPVDNTFSISHRGWTIIKFGAKDMAKFAVGIVHSLSPYYNVLWYTLNYGWIYGTRHNILNKIAYFTYFTKYNIRVNYISCFLSIVDRELLGEILHVICIGKFNVTPFSPTTTTWLFVWLNKK